MANRIAGLHRIDGTLVQKPKANAAPANSPDTSERAKAQLWQLNAFVQAEQKRLVKGEGVLHAKRTGAGAKEGEQISLYIRPKASGLLAFLDEIIHGEEQRLASVVLATLTGHAYGLHVQTPNASLPRLLPALKQLQTPTASLVISHMAPELQAVAAAITAEKLDAPGHLPLARQEGMRNAVRAQAEFKQWELQSDTTSLPAIERSLKPYGFQPEEIAAFDSIVNHIAQRHTTGDMDMDALHKFWMNWVATCERADDHGAAFRHLVCNNETYRAWNVVAHHLARIPQPKFDLRSYGDFSRVMVPDVSDMIWSEAAQDNGATRAISSALHARAHKFGKLEFEPTADKKHQLFPAYKKIFAATTSTSLSPEQVTYLSNAYGNFIGPSINAGESFLLTPLFDYEAGTIDACIDIALTPIKQALEEGRSLPNIGFFSTDSRIDEAFNKALTKLKTTSQSKKTSVMPQLAAVFMTPSPTLEPADKPMPAPHGKEKLKLQVGITDDHWRPSEKTLLVLTGSSMDCLQADKGVIAPELNFILASKEFSAAKDRDAIFNLKQGSATGCANRYIAPVEEVPVEGGIWPIGSARLADVKASDITLAYTKACKDAVKIGIHKLVMTPCFNLPEDRVFGNKEPYKDAIGIMVKTLGTLSRRYPQLELTLVARSKAEEILMREAMQHEKPAAI